MQFDTLIIGAGAAGLMCATQAQGRILVIDHAKAPGEKIRISGGGRCNFTNLNIQPDRFLSNNPHFHKSALSRYTQWDFINLVEKHKIAYHEKTLGQLFCDISAKQIITMLLDELDARGAELWINTRLTALNKTDQGFALNLEREGQRYAIGCRNLVIACGGKSIPKMGATGLAYDIAAQFQMNVTRTRPALVPLTFEPERFKPLAGIAIEARVSNAKTSFDEAVLFTHRGLSGPAILQLSSYWEETEAFEIDLFPNSSIYEALRAQRQQKGARNVSTILAGFMPARLSDFIVQDLGLTGNLADQSDKALHALARQLHAWQLRPAGSEGYRTAEVTLGGVDTNGLSSKTMMSKTVSGLYFIGEAVDVTGWLGGYNFQWAWSSGWAAGQAIAHQPEAPR
ncbi:NAD(P)/FAD-dependent oxidoreductase [Paracoccaceae bacterium]|nr:NAD(P)/FAD-dependent oxidoreductase [Paracoccaceae bacterium]MDC3290565.1 NAD(P)/FAD-dependent oxidoreductase [bacterium]MED7678167.1 aminoacetone oxidase family FAD-binding enzyme [Rhodobacteraceae bacterium IMCC15231]